MPRRRAGRRPAARRCASASGPTRRHRWRRDAARRGADGRVRGGSAAARARGGERCGPVRARIVAERARWRRCSARSDARSPFGGGPVSPREAVDRRPTVAGRSVLVPDPLPRARSLPCPPSPARPGQRPGIATSTEPAPPSSSCAAIAARVRGSGRARAGISNTIRADGASAPITTRASEPQSACRESLRGSSGDRSIQTAKPGKSDRSAASTAPRTTSAGARPGSITTIPVG